MWWLPLVAPLMSGVNTVIERLIPDKAGQDKARIELEAAMMKSLSSVSEGQIEINKIEAAHKSLFVAGWRPFIGWVCGVGLAWAFLGEPVAHWAAARWAPGMTVPIIETDALYQLVLAMLGMGGLRTFEKVKGVSREK